MTDYQSKETRPFSISGYIHPTETVFDHLKTVYQISDMTNEIKSGTYQFFQDIDDDLTQRALYEIRSGV